VGIAYLLSLLGYQNGKLEIIQAKRIVVQLVCIGQETHVLNGFVSLLRVLHYETYFCELSSGTRLCWIYIYICVCVVLPLKFATICKPASRSGGNLHT